MTLDQDKLMLIHEYLTGNIDVDKHTGFKAALEEEKFRAELLRQAQMLDHLDEMEYARILAEINPDQNLVKESKPSYFSGIYMRYAAAFVLILGALFLIRQYAGSDPADYATLIDKHNVSYPAEVVKRGASADINRIYNEGIQAYANNDYNLAIQYFDRIPYTTNTLKMYKANAYIETQQYQAALAQLKELNAGNDILLAQNADWYTLICYLGLEDKAAIESQLERLIADDTHIFYKKAQALKAEL